MSSTEAFRRIFIGSIPEAVQESEIRAAVSRYGTVTTFHYNQAPRGWALVTFDSSEEANAAVSELNERTVFSACQGPIVCRIAHEKKPGEKKSAQSATAASNATYMYGIYGGSHGDRHGHDSSSMYLMHSAIPEHPPPQPAQWLTYYTPEGHPYYYNILTKTTQWEKPPELGQQIMIRPSAATAATVNVMNQAQILAYNQQQQRMMVGGTDPNFNAEILGAKKFGPPGCNLFVFHIPSEWSHKDLYDHFKFFGSIISARVKTEGSGRNLGYGFISYEMPEAAYNAIKSMHGFNVGGKWLKVTLKKGEDHLLPPTLQSVYQRASGKIDDQTSSPTQHQTNYRHPSTSATSTPQAAENGLRKSSVSSQIGANSRKSSDSKQETNQENDD